LNCRQRNGLTSTKVSGWPIGAAVMVPSGLARATFGWISWTSERNVESDRRVVM